MEDDFKFCPACRYKVEEHLFKIEIPKDDDISMDISMNRIDHIMITLCSLSFILTLAPINSTIIIIAFVLAIVSILLSVFQKIQKAHKIWAKILIFSITLLITQASWYVFLEIII